jgi:16S rRNA (cytidine1402-2'-O)-methyltransferase
MRAAFGGDREAVLAREISKLFETVLDGTLASIAETVAADPNQRKGEFVLVIAGAPEDENAALREGRRLYAKLVEVLKPSQAAKIAADLSGASRKDLYGGA